MTDSSFLMSRSDASARAVSTSSASSYRVRSADCASAPCVTTGEYLNGTRDGSQTPRDGLGPAKPSLAHAIHLAGDGLAAS